MADQINGNEGAFISLKKAEGYTKNFRDGNGFESLKGKKGFYVGERKLFKLLGQEGAVGFRAYFGKDEKGNPQMAIVGVDKEGNDILRADKGVEVATEALVLDTVAWCPPLCGGGNGLNGN